MRFFHSPGCWFFYHALLLFLCQLWAVGKAEGTGLNSLSCPADLTCSQLFSCQETRIYFTLYLHCTSSFQQQKHRTVKPWICLHQLVFYCSLSESSLDDASAFSECSLSSALYQGQIPNQFFKALLKFLFSRPLPLHVQISCGTQ